MIARLFVSRNMLWTQNFAVTLGDGGLRAFEAEKWTCFLCTFEKRVTLGDPLQAKALASGMDQDPRQSAARQCDLYEYSRRWIS